MHLLLARLGRVLRCHDPRHQDVLRGLVVGQHRVKLAASPAALLVGPDKDEEPARSITEPITARRFVGYGTHQADHFLHGAHAALGRREVMNGRDTDRVILK